MKKATIVVKKPSRLLDARCVKLWEEHGGTE